MHLSENGIGKNLCGVLRSREMERFDADEGDQRCYVCKKMFYQVGKTAAGIGSIDR